METARNPAGRLTYPPYTELPIEGLIDDLICLIGWSLLKLMTAGRYRPKGDQSDRLFEGTLGLLVVAGVFSVGYRFL